MCAFIVLIYKKRRKNNLLLLNFRGSFTTKFAFFLFQTGRWAKSALEEKKKKNWFNNSDSTKPTALRYFWYPNETQSHWLLHRWEMYSIYWKSKLTKEANWLPKEMILPWAASEMPYDVGFSDRSSPSFIYLGIQIILRYIESPFLWLITALCLIIVWSLAWLWDRLSYEV